MLLSCTLHLGCSLFHYRHYFTTGTISLQALFHYRHFHYRHYFTTGTFTTGTISLQALSLQALFHYRHFHYRHYFTTGTLIFNLISLCQVSLNIYSFENIAYHVLHERIPLYTFQQLSRWWDQKMPHSRWRTAEHYITRCQGNIRILNYSDLVNRTSEFARLFGILFYSVVSRGSQVRL